MALKNTVNKSETEEIILPTKPAVYAKGRTIYFFDLVSNESVCQAIQFIDEMEKESSTQDITIKFNSHGGDCYDGLALYDRLRESSCKIITIGTGFIASMAFVLYLAGDKRFASKNARFLNHQASSDVSGKASDIAIEKKEIQKLEDICNGIIAERTNQSLTKLKEDIKSGDHYMSSHQALKMGIVHHISNYSSKTPRQKKKAGISKTK